MVNYKLTMRELGIQKWFTYWKKCLSYSLKVGINIYKLQYFEIATQQLENLISMDKKSLRYALKNTGFNIDTLKTGIVHGLQGSERFIVLFFQCFMGKEIHGYVFW